MWNAVPVPFKLCLVRRNARLAGLPCLKRRPRLFKKRQLLRAGAAPQNRVAVRVKAKAVDDGLARESVSDSN